MRLTILNCDTYIKCKNTFGVRTRKFTLKHQIVLSSLRDAETYYQSHINKIKLQRFRRDQLLSNSAPVIAETNNHFILRSIALDYASQQESFRRKCRPEKGLLQ